MAFHSSKERRLWVATSLLVLAIYVSLPLVRSLTEFVRERGWLRILVTLALLLGAALFAAVLAKQRPGWKRLLWLLPVAAGYALVLREAVAPEEQLHLIEYGVVGVVAYTALRERRAARLHSGLTTGALAHWPAATAILLTAAAGWLDEGIQHLLPSRYYDLRDVAFNALAALLAVGAAKACTPSSDSYGNSTP